MKALKKIKSNGFTLVEVIITIIIAAVVGTMLFSVLGSSMTKSSEPIFRLQTSLALQQVVENFVTAYEKDFAGDLPALRTPGTLSNLDGTQPDRAGHGVVPLCLPRRR